MPSQGPVSPMAYSVCEVWAWAGKMTESTTGLTQVSGRDFPARIAPLPAAMDFSSLRRDPSEVWFGLVWFGLVWFGLVWFGLVTLHICLSRYSSWFNCTF